MSDLDNNLIVGLDIGTSKVLAIVAVVLPDGQLDVVGIGMHPSRGMRKGIVFNIDATVQSVRRAIEEAELMTGCQVKYVCTGITGNHIRSLNSHGFVAVKSGEVTKEDMARVVEAARAVAIPAEQKILHILPQEYTVDHQNGIADPVGMSGIRLEGKIHIVTGAVSAAQNLVNCVRRCGLEVEDIVLEHLATSQAVLTDDEKQLGVCLIDIGGGTTDIIVYTDGAIRHTSVLSVAGDQVTNDLAVAFRTPHQHAEAVKIKYGCALQSLADKNLYLTLPKVGQNNGGQNNGGQNNGGQNNGGQSKEQELNQCALAAVIEPRYEELFSLILRDLQQAGWDGLLSAGIVLTGGSAKMQGVVELAANVFQTHVRIGTPRYAADLPSVMNNPIYATAFGLVLYAQQMQSLYERRTLAKTKQDTTNVFARVKSWFQGNF